MVAARVDVQSTRCAGRQESACGVLHVGTGRRPPDELGPYARGAAAAAARSHGHRLAVVAAQLPNVGMGSPAATPCGCTCHEEAGVGCLCKVGGNPSQTRSTRPRIDKTTSTLHQSSVNPLCISVGLCHELLVSHLPGSHTHAYEASWTMLMPMPCEVWVWVTHAHVV